MKNPSPNEIIGEFVLGTSTELPATQRITLYRALAQLIGDETDAGTFHALADELEQIERKHRQLVLDFKRRAC